MVFQNGFQIERYFIQGKMGNRVSKKQKGNMDILDYSKTKTIKRREATETKIGISGITEKV